MGAGEGRRRWFLTQWGYGRDMSLQALYSRGGHECGLEDDGRIKQFIRNIRWVGGKPPDNGRLRVNLRLLPIARNKDKWMQIPSSCAAEAQRRGISE